MKNKSQKRMVVYYEEQSSVHVYEGKCQTCGHYIFAKLVIPHRTIMPPIIGLACSCRIPVTDVRLALVQ